MTTTTPGSASGRTRLAPDERRAQLLALGVRLLATRSLDELSVDLLMEEAGISRGLLYHYFGSKVGFHQAVVQHAADELYAQTAPPAGGDPLDRLLVSMEAYVDYVEANHAAYRSIVKAAASGNDAMRTVYDTTFAALADRFFHEDPDGEILPDTPAHRLLVRAWQAMVEELVLAWCEEPAGLGRADLLQVITGSLPVLLGTLPAE